MTRPMETVQRCARCVMSTGDPTVTIMPDGRCNYCHEYDLVMLPKWQPNETGARILERQLEELREATRDDEFQIALGLSGGIDSSYLAMKVKEWDLRVLAVHVDAGWDTPEALTNIEHLSENCGFHHIVVTPTWETIRRLQLAFFRSGVVNQDIPQDHAFFTGLYRTANKYRVRHVLSGSNIATEGVQSTSWGEDAMDSWFIRDIARRDGMYRFPGYPLIGFAEYNLINPKVRRMRVLAPLNLMPYSRRGAIAELAESVGFVDYGGKHAESYFTRFLQQHYMPTRFHIDKREGHLSSRVLSGELTRQEALQELSEPLYKDDMFRDDIRIISERLMISEDELLGFAQMDPHPTRRFLSQTGTKTVIRSVLHRLPGRRPIEPGVYR